MLETLLSGGLTGIVGTIWNGWNNRKLKELELEDRANARDHEVIMIQAESEAMIAESKAEVEIVGARVAGEVEVAETQAFTQSLKSGTIRSFDTSFMDRLLSVQGKARFITIPAGVLVAMFLGLADFVKDMARPGITIYLLGISTWITIQAWALLDRIQGETLTAAMATAIISDAVNVVLYLTVTAVTWWFGDRMAAKGLAKSMKFRSL